MSRKGEPAPAQPPAQGNDCSNGHSMTAWFLRVPEDSRGCQRCEHTETRPHVASFQTE